MSMLNNSDCNMCQLITTLQPHVHTYTRHCPNKQLLLQQRLYHKGKGNPHSSDGKVQTTHSKRLSQLDQLLHQHCWFFPPPISHASCAPKASSEVSVIPPPHIATEIYSLRGREMLEMDGGLWPSELVAFTIHCRT